MSSVDVAKPLEGSSNESGPSTSGQEVQSGSKDGGDGNRPARSPSPENVKCAICLGDVVNKSFSNSCLHQFCFGCLLEWSKVKPECPLCKSTFRTIFHNVRGNGECEEYTVPTQIPHLSIRLTTSDQFSPEIMITQGDIDGSNYNVNEYRFGNGSRDSLRHLQQAIIRDRYRDPRLIRILQWAPYGSGAQARRDSIDVTLNGSYPSDNPFHTEAPDTFGAVLEASGFNHAASPRFSGYQVRRRRYDRNQFVAPFESTLQAGTVFFPSVEYFQTHPSTMQRISPWLHRELTVLLSLSQTRPQMAFVYDIIISCLMRHDIRSREFQDMLRPYLGARTRQFQHEFYYFLLSGMRMEEYDRVAHYPNSSNQSSSFLPNPASVPPAVVTLDSDDEGAATHFNSNLIRNRDVDIEIVLSDDENINAESRDPRPEDDNSRSEWSRFMPFSRPQSESSHISLSALPLPADLPDSLEFFDAPTMSSRPLDPEMPILEPQVEVNRRVREAVEERESEIAIRELSRDPPGHYDYEGRRRRAASTVGLLNSLHEATRQMSRRTMDEEVSLARRDRDPIDGRRSPYPTVFSPHFSPARSTDSDTPYVHRRNRRTIEASPEYSNNRAHNSEVGPGESYRNRLRSYIHQNTNIYESASPPVVSVLPVSCTSDSAIRPCSSIYHPSRELPQRSSCILSNPASSSVQIRIYPTPMDLSMPTSAHQGSSRYNFSNVMGNHHRRTPDRRTSTPNESTSVNQGGETGECEFLGSFQTSKKPPLAVITLSSDDEAEDSSAMKNEPKDTAMNQSRERGPQTASSSANASNSRSGMLATSHMWRAFQETVAPTSSSSYAYSSLYPQPNHSSAPQATVTDLRVSDWVTNTVPNYYYDNASKPDTPLSPRQSTPTASTSLSSSENRTSKEKPKKRTKTDKDRDGLKKDKKKEMTVKPNSRKSSTESQRKTKSKKTKKGKRKRSITKSHRNPAKPLFSSSSSSSSGSEDVLDIVSKAKRKAPKAQMNHSPKYSCPVVASRNRKEKSDKKKIIKTKQRPSRPKSVGKKLSKSIISSSSSTSSLGSSRKLKSVVIKVDKTEKQKRRNRAFKYTSSEDEPQPTTSKKIKMSVDSPCKKTFHRSRTGSWSMTAESRETKSQSSSSDSDSDHEDLTQIRKVVVTKKPLALNEKTDSPMRHLKPDVSSDANVNEDDNGFETDTLLSVGYEDARLTSSSSSSDNTDYGSSKKRTRLKSGVVAGNSERVSSDLNILTLQQQHDLAVLLRDEDTSEHAVGGNLPFMSSHGHEGSSSQQQPNASSSSSSRYLAAHDFSSINRITLNELTRLTPVLTPTQIAEMRAAERGTIPAIHIEYEDNPRVEEDLLDLTVTVTRSRSSSPSNDEGALRSSNYWWGERPFS